METFDIKFLSKQPKSAMAAPSFRIYYGDNSGAIPFTWETTPGTPKHDYFSATNPPPLTPPPSYSYQKSKNSDSRAVSSTGSWRRSYSSSSLLHGLFKSKHGSSQRSMSTLSSSSFSSWTSSGTGNSSGKRRRSTRSWGSSSENVAGDIEEENERRHGGRLSRSVKYCFSRLCFPVSVRSE